MWPLFSRLDQVTIYLVISAANNCPIVSSSHRFKDLNVTSSVKVSPLTFLSMLLILVPLACSRHKSESGILMAEFDGTHIELSSIALTDEEHRALEEARQNPVSLDESAVLSYAKDKTGLDNFGSNDFRERLRVWLELVKKDENRTELGKANSFYSCVQSACKRLRLENLITCNPEILDIQVERPIFIVGPGRSGTTHLHGLVAAGSQMNWLSWHEGNQLFAMEEYPADNTRTKLKKRQAARARTRKGSSLISAVTPRVLDDVAEDMVLMSLDFPIGMLGFREFLSSDFCPAYNHTGHYVYMKRALQALQWQRGHNGRWVLKDPVHALEIPSLLSVFPDATIVLTYRDPAAIVQSVATLMTVACRLKYQKTDLNVILSASTDRVDRMLRAIMNDRDKIQYNDRVDVLFHEFMRDEIGTVRRIYLCAELEMSKQEEKRKMEFLNQHRRYKFGRVSSDIRADFTCDPIKLRRRFDFYTKNIPVKIEVE